MNASLSLYACVPIFFMFVSYECLADSKLTVTVSWKINNTVSAVYFFDGVEISWQIAGEIIYIFRDQGSLKNELDAHTYAHSDQNLNLDENKVDLNTWKFVRRGGII